MNIYRTFAFAVALTLACLSLVFAADNVLSTGADSRLSQKVDFDAEVARVVDALDSLTLRTGVSLTAGVDNNDWMARDRKVTLHVKGITLCDLMEEIASTLRFDWTKSGVGTETVYALVQTGKQAAEEQSLRNSAQDANAKLFRQRRENVLADMANLGSLSKTDAAKLANSDPWRYVLASEPIGRDLADFFNSFSDARNAFLQGTQLSFPASSLPPDLQSTVRRIAESYDSLQQRIGASDDHSDLLVKFDKLQVTINRKLASGASNLLTESLLGGINVGLESESIYVPVFDPASAMARALGRAIVRLQSGLSKEEVGKQLEAELKFETDAQQSASSSGRDITSDPSLKKKIALHGSDTVALMTSTLKLLAEKTGLNVISDSFPTKPATMPGGEKTLGEQLESIRSAYGSNWEKSGNTVRFRDSEWFVKRTWDVPQVWIDYWTARGKANNGLFLEDLVQIAELRDAQIDNTIATSSALMGLGADMAVHNREILRFYASLTYEQQKTMATDQLNASALSDNQWAMLRSALAINGSIYTAAEKGSQYIRLTQSGKDMIEYKFDYYAGPSNQPVEFKLTTGSIYGIADPNTFPTGN
ncbi:MAG: hypothetical protein ABFD49_07365 [Armatimonadota bacterium]|nr:hypothetical protein [bacterium]